MKAANPREPLSGVCALMPEKILKETFLLLALFTDEKRGKSHLRGLSSLLKSSFRAHELVARAMRGKCVRQMVKRKSAVLPLSMVSAISRVRTYHTKKLSRFVHASPARPHNRVGGRGSSTRADGSKDFCQPSPVGEGGARSVTDEVSFLDKATFLFWYFSVKKSTKSHQRERSPLLKSSFRAHELVARAMRGKCVRHGANGVSR